jgi:hypothetical protein
MTQRVPESFSMVDWNLVTIMGTSCRETPTIAMMTRTKTAAPNQTTSASRRSSENPTNTNKREGSYSGLASKESRA